MRALWAILAAAAVFGAGVFFAGRLPQSAIPSPLASILDPETEEYRRKLKAAANEARALANILNTYPTKDTAKKRAQSARVAFSAVSYPTGMPRHYAAAWSAVREMDRNANSAERAADRWMDDRLDFKSIEKAHESFLQLAKSLEESAKTVEAELRK